MKPTKGKVTISGNGKYIDSPDGWIAEVTSWPTSPVKQVVEGSEKHRANGALFVAAWNAAQEINPENPIAAAEAMPEILKACEDLLKELHDGITPLLHRGKPGAFDICTQRIARARKAIAKATAKE